MLKSNQITVTLLDTAYTEARRLLNERAQLVVKVAGFTHSGKSGDRSMEVEKVQEVERKLIHILGSAALDKVLAS